jgi:photosystem II stability/assembly factor-like uncharacterized protein
MRYLLICFITSSAIAQWQPQASHTTESLRGVSIVDRNELWASGTHGTYLVTKDGGQHWAVNHVPGAEELDFRGVEAFHNESFLLAAGPGEKSRIYHERKGHRWELQFINHDAKGFFDCMAFSSPKHGFVVGDPLNGKFQVLRTRDGGRTWQYIDPKKLPPALDGEGAFAASNSCIATVGSDVWFATGGPVARVFHSVDNGETWTVTDAPVSHGSPSQGIFSIAFRDSLHGAIVGGDYAHADQTGPNVATTDDGGKTWKLANLQPQKFFSAIAYVNDRSILVVGAASSGFTEDDLRTWKWLSSDGFNALATADGLTYAVGANGKIARLTAR